VVVQRCLVIEGSSAGLTSQTRLRGDLLQGWTEIANLIANRDTKSVSCSIEVSLQSSVRFEAILAANAFERVLGYIVTVNPSAVLKNLEQGGQNGCSSLTWLSTYPESRTYRRMCDAGRRVQCLHDASRPRECGTYPRNNRNPMLWYVL
jgi:hypothetical protein